MGICRLSIPNRRFDRYYIVFIFHAVDRVLQDIHALEKGPHSDTVFFLLSSAPSRKMQNTCV